MTDREAMAQNTYSADPAIKWVDGPTGELLLLFCIELVEQLVAFCEVLGRGVELGGWVSGDALNAGELCACRTLCQHQPWKHFDRKTHVHTHAQCRWH